MAHNNIPQPNLSRVRAARRKSVRG